MSADPLVPLVQIRQLGVGQEEHISGKRGLRAYALDTDPLHVGSLGPVGSNDGLRCLSLAYWEWWGRQWGSKGQKSFVVTLPHDSHAPTLEVGQVLLTGGQVGQTRGECRCADLSACWAGVHAYCTHDPSALNPNRVSTGLLIRSHQGGRGSQPSGTVSGRALCDSHLPLA